MKKIFCFTAALAAFISSCSVDDVMNDNKPSAGRSIITATIEQPTEPGSRVTMGSLDNGKIPLLWENGDAIRVVNVDDVPDESEYKLTGSSGTASASFELVAEQGAGIDNVSTHYALYPFAATDADIAEGLHFFFYYPDKQNYTLNSCDKDALPLVAKNSGSQTHFTFKAAASVLRLKISTSTTLSDVKIKSIEVNSASKNLIGKSVYEISTGGSESIVFSTPDNSSAGSQKTVILTCPTDGVNVCSTPVDFNIVIPPAEYPANDLTITIHAKQGSADKTAIFKSKSDATFAVGRVYAMNLSIKNLK